VIVVTAGTSGFRKIILRQTRMCKRFGYDHRVYDFGGLGVGEPYTVDPEKLKRTESRQEGFSADFKAELMIKNFRQGETICWLDGDCIPLLPFEPLGKWDAAVTMRSHDEVGRGHRPRTMFLNSGVVFARNIEFARRWRKKTIAKDNCQIALNKICLPELTVKYCRKAIGKTIESSIGLKVKILDAMEWNCWHIPPPKHARILHFKEDLRHLAKDYL
jgi:hypothetical protein